MTREEKADPAARRFVLAVAIGVGRGMASPSLRTGLADLPHPALQSVVSPRRGLADRITGVLQAEQPMFGKEGIRPPCLIGPVRRCDPPCPSAPPKDAPQPTANPAVYLAEGRSIAVLE